MDQIWMNGAHGNRAGRTPTLERNSRVSSRPRVAGVALLACVVLLAAGCAVTEETRRSLAGYAQAMGQVELSANEILTDFSNGRKVQEELKRVAGAEQGPAPPEYPAKFVPPRDLSAPRGEADKALARARQALAVIRQYNDALVALAEGHSEQEVRARAMEFGGALETLVSIAGASIPGLGAFTAVGPKIIKLAEDAANRKQLEQAVKDGREPVGIILTALEAQTSPMYGLSVVGTKQGQEKLQDDIQRAALVLKASIARHGPPIDTKLAGEMAALQAQLGEIGAKTGVLSAMPIPLPYTNGKPAYNSRAHAEIKIFMYSMRAAAQQYVELAAKQNAYYNLMNKYVAALGQTRRSLDLVAESLAKPVDPRAEVDRLLKVAFELRDAMGAYRNPSVTSAAQ